MPLTDTAVRQAKATDKPRKLSDEKGLYLLVKSAGKYWRVDYSFAGKRKTLAIGVYPDITLADARKRRDEARKLLANDIDPGEQRKAQKTAGNERAANSFEVIAREWFARYSPNWAESHSSKLIRRLEKDVFPWLGSRPIAEITAAELLTTMRRLEQRGVLETAHRALQNCGQVFRYAVATGRAERDPTGDLRGALPPVRGNHFAAITSPEEAGALLRAIDSFKGTLVVQCALRLAPLLFVRPGELRKAAWSEFDLDRAEWNIPAERMKARRAHLVPLSTQAIAILRDLHPLTGAGQFVFPGARDHKITMSDAAINAALRRMGYDTKTEITGHGFRAMARTILHEQMRFDRDVIEHQLAHSVPDALGTAYNRTKFIKDRQHMMQAWADYLDKLKAGADIVPFPIKTA